MHPLWPSLKVKPMKTTKQQLAEIKYQNACQEKVENEIAQDQMSDEEREENLAAHWALVDEMDACWAQVVRVGLAKELSGYLAKCRAEMKA